jgi:hypothetical protein
MRMTACETALQSAREIGALLGRARLAGIVEDVLGAYAARFFAITGSKLVDVLCPIEVLGVLNECGKIIDEAVGRADALIVAPAAGRA